MLCTDTIFDTEILLLLPLLRLFDFDFDDLDPDFDVLLEEELLLPFCFPLVEDDDCCLLSPLFLFLFLLRRLRFLEAVLGVCTLDEVFTQQVFTQLGEVFTQCLHSDERLSHCVCAQMPVLSERSAALTDV